VKVVIAVVVKAAGWYVFTRASPLRPAGFPSVHVLRHIIYEAKNMSVLAADYTDD
jgi:hypothetical protein